MTLAIKRPAAANLLMCVPPNIGTPHHARITGPVSPYSMLMSMIKGISSGGNCLPIWTSTRAAMSSFPDTVSGVSFILFSDRSPIPRDRILIARAACALPTLISV